MKNIPDPPKPPPGRIIKEGCQPWCPTCHSPRAYGGFLNLFPKNGCINPGCINYYHDKRCNKISN